MSFFIDNDNNIVQSAPGNNSNWTVDPQTGYLIVLGTSGVQLPSGTTAQRPSVSTGVIRYNTSTGFFEGYNINSTVWQPFQGYFGILNSLGALATNGIIVNNGGTASTVTITAGTAISITNGSGTGGNPTITNTGVTSAVASTGISVSAATGAVTFTNTGVTSNVAGTGISISGATGAVTITNTGVTSIAGTAGDITASAATGSVTLDLATITQSTGSSFVKITLDTKGRVTGNTAVAQSDLTGLLGTYYLPESGGTMTGAINMGSNQINNLSMAGTPASTDAANVGYVQSLVSGLSWKQEVQAGTTGNITLSGLQTIDGYTTIAGDRILVKNQTTTSQNGIYIAASGAWARSTDANTGALLDGAAVFITQGTTQSDTAWVQTDATITIGSSPVVWAQFAGSSTYTAGAGLTLTGNVFSVTTNGITNSLFRQSAANTIVGNPTGSTANVTDITLGSTLAFVSGALQTVAMTGDVTSSANSFATTVAKIQGTTVSGTTGSGNVVFSTSPSLTTPAIGAATGTSLALSSLTTDSFIYPAAAGLLTSTAAATNGQLLIGSTGNAPVAAALTAGTAIGITNGAGSITINNTGVTSIAGTANQITASASTGAVTLSLPANVTITSGLTVSGLTANSFLYSGTAGLLTTTAAPTNGQLLIGSTGAAPSLATLTAGTNISISNTAGAITINTTGVQTALQLYKENPSSPNALTATGTNAVAIGNGASATQTNSMAVGSGSTTEWVTEHALGGSYYSTAGDSKLSFSVATCQTTNATATEIGFNTSSGAPSSYVVPAINSSYYFEVIVTAHRTDVAGTRFCEKLEFLFDKGASSSTAVIVGAPLSTIIARDLAAITSGWAVAISADATNGRPAIKVTGAASQTIRWVAQIRAVKVT
jgi:hypothetical protein